jgi:hypothetical protein
MRNLMILAAIPAAMMPMPATATAVQLASSVFVERFVSGPGGSTSRVLERASSLRKGDRLVFVVNWRGGAQRQFTVTNPLPRTVSFQKSSDGLEQVSVDGGQSWGRLEDLRVREGGRWRLASPEDVTHVRWHVPAPAAVRGEGQILYRGVVR